MQTLLKPECSGFMSWDRLRHRDGQGSRASGRKELAPAAQLDPRGHAELSVVLWRWALGHEATCHEGSLSSFPDGALGCGQ